MSIKKVFDNFCSGMKVDSRFIKDLLFFVNNYTTRNEDHIRFFGNGLLSTEVKWLPSDTNRYFSEILGVDDGELQKAIYALPTIDKDHKVSSNAFNLSTAYLVHAILTSKVSEKDKVQGAQSAMMILHFKFISSILNHYFHHGVNTQTAQRAYEAMNYKFDLRTQRTWYNYCLFRSSQMISRNALHYMTFMKFDDDDAIKYIITDTQTRVRSVIKNITELYYRVRSEGAAIAVTSSLIEMEGEIGVRDLTRATGQYRRYLEGVIGDASSFVRQNLVDIVAESNPSASPQYFQDTLYYLSSIYNSPKEKKVQDFVSRSLTFAFQLISDKGVNQRNLAEVLRTVKGAINSSRSTDREVTWLRNEGDKLVRRATGKKSPYPVSGERTSVILYLVIRAMTMDYFTTRASAA